MEMKPPRERVLIPPRVRTKVAAKAGGGPVRTRARTRVTLLPALAASQRLPSSGAALRAAPARALPRTAAKLQAAKEKRKKQTTKARCRLADLRVRSPPLYIGR